MFLSARPGLSRFCTAIRVARSLARSRSRAIDAASRINSRVIDHISMTRGGFTFTRPS